VHTHGVGQVIMPVNWTYEAEPAPPGKASFHSVSYQWE